MDLNQDSDGDILVTNGNVAFNSGIESIRQHLQIRLRTFAGEWFLNTSVGVPYFDSVFIKNPDLTVLNTVFTKVILDTPGVISLSSLSFEISGNRQLFVSFSAITTNGVLDYSGFIGV